MNKLEFRQLLEEGEGYKIEFKESLSSLDREMVAFANKWVVENHTPKTNPKTNPKTDPKTTLKLPQNYPESSEKGSEKSLAIIGKDIYDCAGN